MPGTPHQTPSGLPRTLTESINAVSVRSRKGEHAYLVPAGFVNALKVAVALLPAGSPLLAVQRRRRLLSHPGRSAGNLIETLPRQALFE